MFLYSFSSANTDVKLKLFYTYCSSLYGIHLWPLSNRSTELIFSCFRRCLRRVLGLPYRTHNELLFKICDKMPIQHWISKRIYMFAINCINSKNHIVKHLAALSKYNNISTMYLNNKFLFDVYKLSCYKCVNINNDQWYKREVNDESEGLVQAVNELLQCRYGAGQVGSLSPDEVENMIVYLCTS